MATIVTIVTDFLCYTGGGDWNPCCPPTNDSSSSSGGSPPPDSSSSSGSSDSSGSSGSSDSSGSSGAGGDCPGGPWTVTFTIEGTSSLCGTVTNLNLYGVPASGEPLALPYNGTVIVDGAGDCPECDYSGFTADGNSIPILLTTDCSGAWTIIFAGYYNTGPEIFYPDGTNTSGYDVSGGTGGASAVDPTGDYSPISISGFGNNAGQCAYIDNIKVSNS